MKVNPNPYQGPAWIFFPHRTVSGGLIILHVLIIIVTSAFLILPWFVNPDFIESYHNRFEYGLFAMACTLTIISLVFNFGWWIPMTVLGLAIGAQFPSAWSGMPEGYINAKFSFIVSGMICGGTFGAGIESLRRHAAN